jgi:hypothetical protein
MVEFRFSFHTDPWSFTLFSWSNFFCSRPCLLLLAAAFLTPSAAHSADWQQPTPEELSMTSQADAPNASAVYLFREETTDDKLHMHSIYVRLKVLTEDGKRYADVEIPYEHRQFTITDVSGRTIHSDGSVVPFTGNPEDKVIQKSAALQYRKKVFSLPDVQIGSIIEYRYRLHYADQIVVPPTWFIQSELYLRKAHYRFVPTQHDLTSGRNQHVSSILSVPLLPKGVAVKKIHDAYEVDVEKIPPEPIEEYLPPIHSYSYRVYFLYSPYDNGGEFWKDEGKHWSKQADDFMSADKAVKGMVSQWTVPGEAQDVKLRKLYAGVMSFENTDYTRQRSEREEKSEGFRTIRNVQDIVERKRGTSEELTLLFVALARSAGLKAYLMAVTNRATEVFNPNVLSMDQLEDDIAIVNVDGKEQFFDPGERYCAYGQLHWTHTLAGGLRQVDGGTAFAHSPDNVFKDSKTVRVADLQLDESGGVKGTIQVGYSGSPALAWRQRALETDRKEIEHDMEDSVREELPNGLTVQIDEVLYLNDPSKQLVAKFRVSGPLATLTAKRMFVPLELFEANAKPKFLQPKRELPVYFHYGYEETDQISITYPESVTVESSPKQEQFIMKTFAALQEGSEVKRNSIVLFRDFSLAWVVFTPDSYDELRGFYGQVARKDQEQAVLKVGAHESGN